ncbi:macrolide transporter ATP-binding /permease protein [Pelotomaculum schinkii]|uniref:Macrolide transporter ATP-binding /permease protein n=1 Tax=Pelotomaculum schinkii TaxID=78350 RepID=A0A4Y7RFZ6_9FIRM|nr:FtsX-like permease family protein [Pelotomaculum schinkii]TEB07928.1 macrolide transporter ATP-binding /permease protein [Pelotomaculum schinkii]
MNGYLDLGYKYLAAHKKRTRLSIFSIVLSVALVVGIFSMLDVLLKFEKVQVIHDYGNYHLLVNNATDEEKEAISSRIDVKNTGTWISFKSGSLNSNQCDIVALNDNFATNMNMNLLTGTYPEAENELMIENWVAEKLGVGTGDTVSFAFEDKTERPFVISGIFADYAGTKASGEPGVAISMKAAEKANVEKTSLFLIEFKERANMKNAEQQIMESLRISEDRIGRNDRLLAVIGQSDHKAAVGLYQVGAILFFIVLIAGVVMIYNTFNISVTDRMRSFGLLRCVGASKAQIRKLVKKEGFLLLRWAIPGGVLLGIAATLFCCALLKFYNSYLFSDIPLFTISPAGILAGAAVGVLTVTIATLLPAKKASRVSPVNAVTGNSEIRMRKAQKEGILTKLLPIESAMGIGSAAARKKTLILMSASIALSIMMFLGFNVFVDFLHTSLKTTKPYTPDISLTSKEGLSPDLYAQITHLPGIKHVYGRMFGYVNATFDASRLTEAYMEEAGGSIEVNADGLFETPEKSWLISYDQNQLKWAKTDLVEGELSEDTLNAQDGIIAVLLNTRKGVSVRTAELHAGDKVYIDTVSGEKPYTVMAVLRSVPFADSNLNLATFITTEKQYTKITGDSTLKIIDIQLKKNDQEETVSEIKRMIGNNITYLDLRQKNSEMNQTFLTMAVFVYGFVVVIALISILNIVSTMNTSITSKMRYLGVLRAVGMSGKQLNRMIAAEASAYCITGTVVGCVLGMLLQKALITQFLTAIKIVWVFPLVQIVCVFASAFLVTRFSIIGPLKKIKTKSISENIGSLQ